MRSTKEAKFYSKNEASISTIFHFRSIMAEEKLMQ